MSDYYLADQKAEERTRQRQRELEPTRAPKKVWDMKVTLVGDFRFRLEPQGLRSLQQHERQVHAKPWPASRSPLSLQTLERAGIHLLLAAAALRSRAARNS